jgi:hypothetical protein
MALGGDQPDPKKTSPLKRKRTAMDEDETESSDKVITSSTPSFDR